VKPTTLTTARLVLDQPTLDDVDVITAYCQDPVFEEYMVTPWPYVRKNAEVFVGTLVPQWWAQDSEYTWALRLRGELLGIIGYRTGGHDIGFWLGAPHRGNGYMPEAVGAVLDWVFSFSDADVIWECKPGNFASVAVARKSGFSYAGAETSLFADRDGGHLLAWRGTLARSDARGEKPGWPTAGSV
jgi:RimJ/RimL family protein N-acetyltransferase